MNERFLSVGFACVVVGLFGLALQALCCLSPARIRYPGTPAVLEGRPEPVLNQEKARGDDRPRRLRRQAIVGPPR